MIVNGGILAREIETYHDFLKSSLSLKSPTHDLFDWIFGVGTTTTSRSVLNRPSSHAHAHPTAGIQTRRGLFEDEGSVATINEVKKKTFLFFFHFHSFPCNCS